MGQSLRHSHYTDPMWKGFYQTQLQNLRTLIVYIKRGNVKVVRDFIWERRISEKSYRDYPANIISEVAPVEVSCRIGNIEMVKALIDKGFSPNGVSNSAPINIACAAGAIQTVRILVETYHVSIKKADKSGNTPLSSAVEGNSVTVISYLLEKGLDPKSLHRHADFLHDVAQRGYVWSCRFLLERGFKVNRVNANGDTALKLAALNLHKNACAVLLKAGADITSVSVCDITKKFIHRSVRKQAGPVVNDYVETVRLLAEHGADPDEQDRDGNTSLHLLHTNFFAVHFLVCDMNVSLDKKNIRQETPFTLALKSDKNSKIIKLLLNAGYHPGPKECPPIVIDSPLIESHKGKKILQYIEKFVSNPNTLQQICCFRLRRELGVNLHSGINSLGLPERLKQMVMLRVGEAFYYEDKKNQP